ncbi:MAG: hypothetical protein HY716_06100 [Planctomycetes bacterium]|nr:hypothetical protein [Planctomycetota bacterium]
MPRRVLHIRSARARAYARPALPLFPPRKRRRKRPATRINPDSSRDMPSRPSWLWMVTLGIFLGWMGAAIGFGSLALTIREDESVHLPFLIPQVMVTIAVVHGFITSILFIYNRSRAERPPY